MKWKVRLYIFFFFFNDTATTEIYTLSLHDALPISLRPQVFEAGRVESDGGRRGAVAGPGRDLRHRLHQRHLAADAPRSEEHTSELQSRQYLVCRLLLEKKNKTPVLTRYITKIPITD